MKAKKGMYYLEKITKIFEIAIAIILLIVVAIKVIENVSGFFGIEVIILTLEFEGMLSVALGLVIGVEFTKMLVKHTSESIVDVLLFAIARQMVVYHERTIDLLIGVVAIAGLFAIKKFLLGLSLHNGGSADPE